VARNEKSGCMQKRAAGGSGGMNHDFEKSSFPSRSAVLSGSSDSEAAKKDSPADKNAPGPDAVVLPKGWMLAQPLIGVGPFVLMKREKEIMQHVTGPYNVTVDDEMVKNIHLNDRSLEFTFCGRRRLEIIIVKPPLHIRTPDGVEFGMTFQEVTDKVGKLIPSIALNEEENIIESDFPDVDDVSQEEKSQERGTSAETYFSLKSNGVMFGFHPEHKNLSLLAISTDYHTLSDIREISMDAARKR